MVQVTHERDAFISYASQDKAVADAICKSLESAGVACWIAPRDVRPGEFYAESIVHAIDSTKVIALVLSNNAADSPHVLREVERASSKRHAVISFRIDAAALPAGLEYFLNSSQWLDASSIGVDRALPRFVDAVKSAAQQPSGLMHINPGPSTIARVNWRGRLMLVALAVIVAAALAYLAADRFWLPKHELTEQQSTAATPTVAINDKSIAVLPFVDMSEKHDQEYFGDGLSEELIDHLAHTPGLKVIARTSSFQFKGRNEDMRAIGQRLGVANLLEGSVRTSGKTVRVTAQLIKASDGSHLWSEAYDRDMRDIFKVQDAIAAAVVTALQVTLATSSARERPVNTEAYKAVLRGRYFNQMGTKEDSGRAIDAYREATRLDPTYAIAFAELANTYDIRASYDWMPIKEAYAEARAAIDKSLKLDPTLAIAHRVLGWIERDFKYDFVTARVEQQRADQLDPADPAAMRDAGRYAFIAGNLAEAIRVSRQLVERDPLDADAWLTLTVELVRADRLTEAEVAARTVLELNPRLVFAHGMLAFVLLYEHKPNAALAMANQETDALVRSQVLSDVLWALGRRAEADGLLAEFKAKYGDSEAFVIAERYAVRNERDEAFLWLDRAYENRVPEVTLIRTDESLQNLHGDPRWTAFLRKLKLPE